MALVFAQPDMTCQTQDERRHRFANIIKKRSAKSGGSASADGEGEKNGPKGNESEERDNNSGSK